LGGGVSIVVVEVSAPGAAIADLAVPCAVEVDEVVEDSAPQAVRAQPTIRRRAADGRIAFLGENFRCPMM
jgi:hypothetical protein